MSGYQNVSFTTSDSHALELHAANHYHLIILDLRMPDMDGFEVMKALRTSEVDDYLPVLALTGEPSYKLQALKAGARDFITKPIDVEEALTRIHNMLEV